MSILDDKHKRKSMAITIIVDVAVIVLLFYVGLSYLDPPLEQGIAVNFGTTETGSGNIQPTERIQSAPKQNRPQPVPQPKSEIKEDVVTQDNKDAPVIKKEKVTREQTQTPVKEVPKKRVKQPDPTPDRSTSDALSSILDDPKIDGTSKGGQGNDNSPGDKGSPDGDFNSDSQYGIAKGLDGDGNYLLGGRNALNKEKFLPKCDNIYGIVVVKIEVDKKGNVISAMIGRGGNDNTKCLEDAAKLSALATKFNADNKAPAKQIGKIVYRFRLPE